MRMYEFLIKNISESIRHTIFFFDETTTFLAVVLTFLLVLESVARAGTFSFVVVEIAAMAISFALQTVDGVGTGTNLLG
jgi:hypothetical protein